MVVVVATKTPLARLPNAHQPSASETELRRLRCDDQRGPSSDAVSGKSLSDREDEEDGAEGDDDVPNAPSKATRTRRIDNAQDGMLVSAIVAAKPHKANCKGDAWFGVARSVLEQGYHGGTSPSALQRRLVHILKELSIPATAQQHAGISTMLEAYCKSLRRRPKPMQLYLASLTNDDTAPTTRQATPRVRNEDHGREGVEATSVGHARGSSQRVATEPQSLAQEDDWGLEVIGLLKERNAEIDRVILESSHRERLENVKIIGKLVEQRARPCRCRGGSRDADTK